VDLKITPDPEPFTFAMQCAVCEKHSGAAHVDDVPQIWALKHTGSNPDSTEIVLPDAEPGEEPELSAYTFVPLYELHDYANPHQERRVRAAVAALDDKVPTP
jgi:hypothetical protein